MTSTRLWMLNNALLAFKTFLLHPRLIPKYAKTSIEILQRSGVHTFLSEARSLLLRGDQISLDDKIFNKFPSGFQTSQLEPFLKPFLPKDRKFSPSHVREDLIASGMVSIRELLASGASIRFPLEASPLVSIIIPVFNKAPYTYHCLRSILSHSDEVPYEVILVDDASDDETRDLMGRLQNAGVIRNGINRGFIASCNTGAEIARGRYLLFLNNDTLVTQGWLNELVRTMETYPSCGAVGAKMVYPEGFVQEAGSLLWQDGSALGYGRGDDPSRPEYSYLREVAYCSAACLMVNRDLFLGLGGFDRSYEPAYYEDSDLCLGIKQLGYKVVYQPKCTVIHLEFGSSNTEEAIASMRANKPVFVRKWKNLLDQRLPYSPRNVLMGRDERSGERLLVLDDKIPTSHMGSGFPRAYKMLRFLAELGYVTTFFPLDDKTPYQPWLDELQQMGVEIFYKPHAKLDKLLEDRFGYYDGVIISRPHNGARYLATLRSKWPDTAIIYDAEALFCIRDILKARMENVHFSDEQLLSIVLSELKPMRYADMVLAVSQREASVVSSFLRDVPSRVWGHPIEFRKPNKPYAERKGFLFVGGFPFPNSPNEAAVLYFMESVWPIIRTEIDCKVYIVGPNPPAAIRNLAREDVVVTGYVEDLRELYETCRIFVAPHLYAAGLPWKVHEAMSYGIPCVVSQLMGYQLGITDGNEALVARDAFDFARKAVLAYRDEGIWTGLQSNALQCIRETCGPEELKDSLHNLIREALTLKRRRAKCPPRRSSRNPAPAGIPG